MLLRVDEVGQALNQTLVDGNTAHEYRHGNELIVVVQQNRRIVHRLSCTNGHRPGDDAVTMSFKGVQVNQVHDVHTPHSKRSIYSDKWGRLEWSSRSWNAATRLSMCHVR